MRNSVVVDADTLWSADGPPVGSRRGVMMAAVNARQRIIDHGEVFTPPGLVRDMLDLVAHECERIDSRFLEPACGDGNFLAEVLRRKLLTVNRRNRPRNPAKWQRDAILAVSSLYGVDLLADNIAACRDRLLAIVVEAYEARFKKSLPSPARGAVAYILSTNIVQGDALTLKDWQERPLVFPEWSPVNGTMIKRKDFAFLELLEPGGGLAWSGIESESGHSVFLPQPVRDYRPCHFLKVAETRGQER